VDGCVATTGSSREIEERETDLVRVEEGGLPEEALHVAGAADALVHRHLADDLMCVVLFIIRFDRGVL
jgi:hypothetical protein